MSERRTHGLVVPVKPPAHAKSRLSPLGDEARRQLAIALALDTIDAARRAERVGAVVVVTDDHRFAALVRHQVTLVLPDGASDDLNVTLEQAAAELVRRAPRLRPVALCADLPALRPHDLDRALGAGFATDRLCFVADAKGVGTTMVAAPDLTTFRPRFGPDSRARHRDAGGLEIDPTGLDSLRHDVDSPADLQGALRMGAGRRTTAAAAAAGLAPPADVGPLPDAQRLS